MKVRVEDGRGGVAPQDFALTVATEAPSRPPVITSTPPQLAKVGRAYLYDAVATDPDNDPLAWSLDAAPAGVSINPLLGTVRWTPVDDQVGTHTVILRVTDALGESATQVYTIDVWVGNLLPVFGSTPPTRAAVAQLYSYSVRATDPDGDPLQFSLRFAPTGMTIDAATGQIYWIPASNQAGEHAVEVRVEDGQGGTAAQPYRVVVAAAALDRPPAITSTPPFAATVDTLYPYQVTASDPEGQPLTFSLLAHPAGMTIDAATGLVQWTPTPAQLGGGHSVTVAAADPAGNAATQSFTITVRGPNRAPRFDSAPVATVTAGLMYRYDVRASDSDSDRLSYRLDVGPAGMTIDTFGRVTWATGVGAVGPHPVTLVVTDDRGLTAAQTFTLTVHADTQAPRVSLTLSENPARIGTSVIVVASATDDVGVASLGLTLDGTPVALDATGRATLPADRAGQFNLVATARDAAGNPGSTTTVLQVFDPSDGIAPTVALTSPADGAVLATFTDVIGSVTDDRTEGLTSTLSVAPVDGGNFTVIASGAGPVTAGVLGQFDPSLLSNDSYILRLTATDLGGNVSTVERTVSVAGDLKLGNFTLSFADLTVPVSGIPITVIRTYDTLTANRQDDFGFGWRLEFADVDLRHSVRKTGLEDEGIYNAFRDGTRVYVTVPGGQREGFTFRPEAWKLLGLEYYKPRFEPDPGVTSRLTVPEATLLRVWGQYVEFGPLGGGKPYNPDDPWFGNRYTLTTKEGTVYQINARTGDLDTASDRNGNALTFTDAGIFSKSGQKVLFERDPPGRIIAVVDPMGQRIRYGYDAKGDLVSVTDRESNTTRFVYRTDRPHSLEQVIDPLGRTGVRSEYDEQGRLFRLIDAAGNPVRLLYDTDDSLQTVYDQLGNPTVYEYDTRGNIITEVDALNGITRRTYDLNNNMLTETDPLLRTTTYTYDAAGNVLTTTDPLGNVNRYSNASFVHIGIAADPMGNTVTNLYDGRGNLIAVTDAAGNITRNTYDNSGNLTSVTDPAGNITKFAYDSSGYRISQEDALGHKTTFTNDANGNPLTRSTPVTTPSGSRMLVASQAYDAEGRPTSISDEEGNITRTEFDAFGRPTAIIDSMGRKGQARFDDRGLPITIVYADGTASNFTYDAAGRRITSTDQAGRTTHFKYDALGRLVETIYPDEIPGELSDNPRTRTEYDAAGRVTAQVDKLGHRTEFGYNAAGRQVLVRNALGQETITSYDAAGRQIATTDALGRTTRFVYDPLGRLVQTLFVDGTSTATTYDVLGRVIVETDQAGRSTWFEYDPLDRLTAVVDALSQRTEYGYDEAGNLITQKDANGHITRHEYDGLGHRIATVLPLGQRSNTTYDAVGNVISTTDFNHDTVIHEYDVNNRLTAKRFPDGSSVTSTYTAIGQRATVTDARGVTIYTYDARDRLIYRTDPDGRVIAYTHDLAGNRISVIIPSDTTTYTFDDLNRLASVIDPDRGVTRYTYDVVGNLVRTELPNGTVESRQYDGLNRLVFLENRGPNGVISSYRYTLSPTGRRNAVVENTGRRVDYGYDRIDQIIDEIINGPIAGPHTIHYEYDPVGNRLSRNDSAEGLTVYTYDDNDRLLTETLGAGSRDTPTTTTATPARGLPTQLTR